MVKVKIEVAEPDFLEGLTEAEKHAVKLVKTSVDCFNGIGMMEGVSRYGVLEGRLLICATASRKLTEFWGKLMVKMQWPTPPKRVDEEILPLLTTANEPLERATLKSLREQPAMIIMLARAWREAESGRKSADEGKLDEEWDGLLSELSSVKEVSDAV